MHQPTLDVARSRSRRARATALVAIVWGAAAAAAACGDKNPEAPELDFQGGYRLEGVRGQPLPIPVCYPFPPCDTLKAGRVEVMSRGRIRDILQFHRTLKVVPLDVDTAISPYQIDKELRILVEREQFGGGEVTLGGHVDTAIIDPSGRLLLTRRVFQKQVVPPMPFLYVKE